MSLLQQIASLPAPHYWALTGASLLLSAGGFYLGLRSLKRARLIEDVPTARIRSAHQGYVELSGSAEALDGEPIIAPLSGFQCCWYRYQIDERNNDRWRTVDKGVSDGLFMIRDETGDCIIDPDHAEVTPQHKQTWHGSNRNLGAITSAAMTRAGRAGSFAGSIKLAGFTISTSNSFGQRYKYTEELILPGDHLYAMGYFKTLDDIDHQQNRAEIIRAILQEWKQNRQTLLARFDHNRDGEIGKEEWATARTAAELRGKQEYAEQLQHSHIHMMRRPPAGEGPFLLSSLHETGLVRRYRWKAGGALVVFFAAGIAATTLLNVRFGLG